MDFGERAGDAVLDKVVRRDRISRQLPRITSQSWDQRLNIPVQGIVRGTLLGRTGLSPGRTIAIRNRHTGSLGLHIHHHAPSFSICCAQSPGSEEAQDALAPALDLIDLFVRGS
jgi:hypothetical protein